MKANHRPLPAFVAAAAILLLVGSCARPRVEPAPTPAPSPRPAPSPLPGPQIGWQDAPLTPGDWRWAMEGGQSVARFAAGAFVLRCTPASGTVTLERAGSAQGDVPMSIATSAMSRPLSGTATAGPPPRITVTFSARDPLLDAMAFSRGRFAVETAGLPTLYVPSWTEVSRVIEDCR